MQYLSRKGCLQANLIPIVENRGPWQGEEQQLVESEEVHGHKGRQEPRLRRLQERTR